MFLDTSKQIHAPVGSCQPALLQTDDGQGLAVRQFPELFPKGCLHATNLFIGG